MTSDELYSDFEAVFSSRGRFVAGLLIAFINFLTALQVPEYHFNSFEEFLRVFPRQLTTATGKRANTLIVQRHGQTRTLSIRPAYNKAEQFFRAEQKRFDSPSCAPHATQAWQDYRHWLDALVTFTPRQLEMLRAQVIDHVLAVLPSQEFDPDAIPIDPPLFRLVLEDFEMVSQRGEPTGAAYQGIVFGFLRADNPHLQIEIGKVRTGSKRVGRIGDIDGWEGARLAISAEVKQYVLHANALPNLAGFANEVGRRGTLGLIIALAFEEGVREAVEALGVKALDRDDLLRIVELWDPLKQRTAVQSFVYYVQHVEQNSSLSTRLKSFLESYL